MGDHKLALKRVTPAADEKCSFTGGVARLDYGAAELVLAQFELQQRVLPFHAKKLFVLFLVAVFKLLADTLVCIECFKLLADSTQVDAGESEELLHKSMYESQILYRLKLLHPFF